MMRREFFRRIIPGLSGEAGASADDGRESLRELFLKAMEKGLDPASYTPEALRAMLADEAPDTKG